jgi:hypothetical protein
MRSLHIDQMTPLLMIRGPVLSGLDRCVSSWTPSRGWAVLHSGWRTRTTGSAMTTLWNLCCFNSTQNCVTHRKHTHQNLGSASSLNLNYLVSYFLKPSVYSLHVLCGFSGIHWRSKLMSVFLLYDCASNGKRQTSFGRVLVSPESFYLFLLCRPWATLTEWMLTGMCFLYRGVAWLKVC